MLKWWVGSGFFAFDLLCTFSGDIVAASLQKILLFLSVNGSFLFPLAVVVSEA